MKIGSIVKMTNPGDGYQHIAGVYGIVLSFPTEMDSEYIVVRTFIIQGSHIHHGITECFKHRFTEVP